VNWQSRLASTLLASLLVTACSNSSGPGRLSSCGSNATPVSLGVAAYTSIDATTDSGCVTFAANTAADTAEYLVLPWSAGGTPGSSTPFTLVSGGAAATAIAMARTFGNSPSLGSGTPSPHGPLAVAFDRFLRESGRTRRYTLPAGTNLSAQATQYAVPSAPPVVGDKRTFKVCAKMDCSSFDNVGAVAKSVGVHIAIYVDTLAPSPGLTQSDLDSLKGVFDTRLYTLDTLTFGHVSDIDNNSVVIVLMTNTVNKLVSTTSCNNSNSYVAGFFFPADLAPGISQNYNNGEIFYSIVADPSGTLSCAHKAADVNDVTPVTFTHEFQHMINFVEHVLVKGGNGEEGWLDEGLSKYAEEIAGRSFGDNQHFAQFAISAVYDGYQYLLDPGSSPLMIPEDTGSLAEVGASWLFTRYIVDQFGDSLPGKLVRTAMSGASNVTAQTGQPFAQTVAHWALANWVANLSNFSAPPELQYKSWNFRHTFDTLHVQNPQVFPRSYPLVPIVSLSNAVNVSGKLWSGSGEYVRVMQPPNGAAFALHLGGQPNSTAVGSSIVPRLVVLRIR
jgi:hypothetical protein